MFLLMQILLNDFFWFAPPVRAQAEGQGAMLHCVGLRNFGFAKLRTNDSINESLLKIK